MSIQAQAAYEEDRRRKPTYHNGQPRPAWEKLGDFAKMSWESNPTPRTYPNSVCKEIEEWAGVIRNAFVWGSALGFLAILATL